MYMALLGSRRYFGALRFAAAEWHAPSCCNSIGYLDKEGSLGSCGRNVLFLILQKLLQTNGYVHQLILAVISNYLLSRLLKSRRCKSTNPFSKCEIRSIIFFTRVQTGQLSSLCFH